MDSSSETVALVWASRTSYLTVVVDAFVAGAGSVGAAVAVATIVSLGLSALLAGSSYPELVHVADAFRGPCYSVLDNVDVGKPSVVAVVAAVVSAAL